MNNLNMSDTRSRRNILNWTGIFPFQPVTNYSSDSSKIKMDIKNSIGENLFLNNLHLIPDPLKKNLADSIITGEVKTKTNMASETKTFVNEPKMKDRSSEDHRADFTPPLGGITNFLSGVINFVSSAMFLKRTDSPTQYYECFEQNFDEMAPSLQTWHLAKPEVQNKNGRAHNVIVSTNEPTNVECSTMNSSCRIAAAQGGKKVNQVHLFLQNQHLQYQSQIHSDSPKIYVEQSSIEDCYEDAFSCEDFETISDQNYFEYFGPFSNQNPELLVSDAPRMKTEHLPHIENMEITSNLPVIIKENAVITDKILDNRATDGRIDLEPQIVETCEEKMNKLKALLQEKRKNKSKKEFNSSDDNLESTKNNEQHTQPIMIPNSNSNNILKNCKQEHNTENDVFRDKSLEENVASIKSIDDLNCSEFYPEYLDPSNYFNEVTGKFCSTSVDSDDSFQIVFADSPKSCRGRIPSECESEDSFIVFEDSPDSCYSSKDVFGDEIYVSGINDEIESSSDSDSDEECDDSDSESDSGCDAFNQTCKLSHSLTRTIGDLTDDSLYNIDEDEVDCAAVLPKEKPIINTADVIQVNPNNIEVISKNSGLLIDEKRKLEKQKLPKKSVRFSEKPPKVHVMRVWAFAARQARAGHWERHALDRERFKRRINDVEMAVSWVLKPQHRSRVMFQRFMPWWNAQKRKELAEIEQKKKEEEDAMDSAPNGTYDADSTDDSKADTDQIENNFEKYNDEEKILNGDKNMQMNERPNGTYEKEIDEKSTAKTNTPKCIRKNGKILTNGPMAVLDNNKNVLKFGFEDNIIVST